MTALDAWRVMGHVIRVMLLSGRTKPRDAFKASAYLIDFP